MLFDTLWITLQQPASWRGIPFLITGATIKPQRNVAVHQYPYKETGPKVEDLGPAPIEVSVQGYVDIGNQVDMMSAANKVTGTGELVHPNLGRMNAALINASFAQSKDALGVVSISFVFIIVDETGGSFAQANTQGVVGSIVQELQGAYASDFIRGVSASLNIARGVSSAVTATIGMASGITRDATGAINAVRGVGMLLGSGYTLGRYNDGGLTSIPPALSSVPDTAIPATRVEEGVSASLGAATTARTKVDTSSFDLANTGYMFA
jgi:prophage DNA circulation protein